MIKVVFSNVKKIYGLDDDQLEVIKEELTLDNPKYEQVKKYSKYKNTNVPKYLFYYVDRKTHIEVPSGYTLPFEHFVVDERKPVRTPYMPFKLDLRETQQMAYESYINNTDKGVIVLPTGKGKSILGMYLAYSLRQRALIIVHKDDLVDGWTKDSKLCFGDNFKMGLIKASKRNVGAQITVATIQTLNRLSDKELQTYLDMFGMIIVDEAHHAPASSYDVLDKANCKYKIGLTATDEREDGLRSILTYHLGEVSYRYVSDENDEDILPVEVIIKDCSVGYVPQVVKHLNKEGKSFYSLYDPIKHKGKQTYNITEINYKLRPRIPNTDLDDIAVTHPTTKTLVTKCVLEEYKLGRSCVMFLSQKEHCRIYKDHLVSLGIPDNKIQLYYGDSKESKSLMKERAESKEVLITIATYSIATEGTNVQAWEVGFLVSSINNEKNTEQASGRIRRAKSGKINPVRQYDFRYPNVYLLSNHGFTRDKRYRKLKFKIIKAKLPSGGLFSRGFKR